LQDRGEEHASAAPDIDEGVEAREVVRGHDIGRLLRRPARHRRLEFGLVAAVVPEVLEELRAVHVLERNTAREHGVEQASDGPVVQITAQQRRTLQHAEALTDRREPEPPIIRLRQHVLGGEAPQHPRQRRRLGADRGGDLGSALRSVAQHIGDLEAGGHIQELRDEVPVEQAGELPCRFHGALIVIPPHVGAD
jgi:hypothetical protein